MATLKRKADVQSASASDLKKPKKDSSLISFFGAPKPTTSSTNSAGPLSTNGPASESPPVRFDKDKWIASLSTEQRKLLKLEIDTLDPSWLAYLKEDVVSRDFLDLKRFLQKEIDGGQKIFPPLEEVYSW